MTKTVKEIKNTSEQTATRGDFDTFKEDLLKIFSAQLGHKYPGSRGGSRRA